MEKKGRGQSKREMKGGGERGAWYKFARANGQRANQQAREFLVTLATRSETTAAALAGSWCASGSIPSRRRNYVNKRYEGKPGKGVRGRMWCAASLPVVSMLVAIEKNKTGVVVGCAFFHQSPHLVRTVLLAGVVSTLAPHTSCNRYNIEIPQPRFGPCAISG